MLLNTIFFDVDVFLTLTFAITVYKCQNFTMSKIMLKLNLKNNTTDKNYVALSRVWSIDIVLFDNDFSYNRFSIKFSIDTMNKLNEIVKKTKIICCAECFNVSDIERSANSSIIFVFRSIIMYQINIFLQH